MPHVLIVDDDPQTREALVSIIAADGLTTATAGDLREARIQLVRQTPDVVFTDLQLPDGSGVDLFEDLDPRSGVEIIVITGHATVESAVTALKMGATDYLAVSRHDEEVAAARADGVVLSKDSGQTWWPMATPQMLTRIHRVTFSSDGTLWLGAREGVYFTRDLGKTWLWVQRLPFRDVDDLSFDESSGRVLVSSRSSDQIYGIDPKTLTWKWWTTGYPVALIRAAGSHLVAASLSHGVLLEPPAASELPAQSASLPEAESAPAQ